MLETAADMDAFLTHTTASFTLDTGHLYLGGADPLALVDAAFDRIAHVHLKDIDAKAAGRLQAGELTLLGATFEGLFPRLGDGAVPVAEAVAEVAARGYEGWYVLEQDVSLDVAPPPGVGPIVDARASLDYLFERTAELTTVADRRLPPLVCRNAQIWALRPTIGSQTGLQRARASSSSWIRRTTSWSSGSVEYEPGAMSVEAPVAAPPPSAP